MMFLFRDDQSGVISNVVLRGKCAGKNQNQTNKKTSWDGKDKNVPSFPKRLRPTLFDGTCI